MLEVNLPMKRHIFFFAGTSLNKDNEIGFPIASILSVFVSLFIFMKIGMYPGDNTTYLSQKRIAAVYVFFFEYF